MEHRVHGLLLQVICILFYGNAFAVSNSAFRNLNAKVNLLKTSLQREIDGLKFEVLDLKMDLDLERAKTARLEELLNGTDVAVDTVPSGAQNGDTTATISAQLASQADRPNLQVLDRAFHDLKHEVKELEADVTTKFEIRADASAALTSSIVSMNSELIRVGRTANATGEVVAELQNDLQEVSDKVDQVQRSCDEEIDAVKKELLKPKSEDTTLAPTSTTEDKDTTLPSTPTTESASISKCRQTIRAGGEAMAKLLYVGATVKRGKDWKWGDQDGHGYGKMEGVDSQGWVDVEWEDGYQNRYRMGISDGKSDAFDLMIVEDQFDFSRCAV